MQTNTVRAKGDARAKEDRAGDMIRRLERLLLKLDYNFSFSAPSNPAGFHGEELLKDLGLT